MSLTDASGCSQRKIFLDFPPFWRFSALYGSWAAQAPGSVKKIEINTCFDKLVPWVNIKRGSIGMKKDLLFEIGTEEIPAGFVPRALASLKAALEGRLSSGRLEFDSIMTMGTPRRLALMVKGLTDSQPDARVEVRGPNTKAALDEGGKPTRALEGFARAQGVKLKDIKVVKTDKGEHVLAVGGKGGEDVKDTARDIKGGPLNRDVRQVHALGRLRRIVRKAGALDTRALRRQNG